VQAAVDQAANAGAPLRTVVSCAAIDPSMRIFGKKGGHDLDIYATVVKVNLIDSFNVLALAAEKMAATEPLEHGQRGVVVNTASVAAFDGQVGQAAYSSSKGGGVGLTLLAARPRAVRHPGLHHHSRHRGDADAGHRVGGVPGRVGSRREFPQRLGRPEEYAQLALSIIDHDYLNGETIRMDGALRMAAR